MVKSMNASDSASSTSYSAGSVSLVCAELVLPISRAPIAHGAVAVLNNRIIDLGTSKQLIHKYSESRIHRLSGIILPGLVNAHTHLELSHLNPSFPAQGGNFTDWIDSLLQRRLDLTISRDQIVDSFRKELRKQKSDGVILVVDTGNEEHRELGHENNKEWPEVYRMLEIIAPHAEAASVALHKINDPDFLLPATGHSTYSTIPSALAAIKEYCRTHDNLFSIHTAESRDELQFVNGHKGIFRNFLEKRNSWDGSFSEQTTCDGGVVDYLHKLGLLDHKTLLVHCVHVGDKELELICKTGAHICVCPCSNDFLNVGKAPLQSMLQKGILPAIGTDSIVSNEMLCMWREMQLLTKDNPEIPAEVILGMATLGGARVLNRENDFGTLEVGRRAEFLTIPGDISGYDSDPEQYLRTLFLAGRPDNIEWVSL